MNMAELNNLSLNNLGDWPVPVKIASVVLLAAAALGAGYYFDTQHQLVEWDRAKADEVRLFEDYEKKQMQANSLEQLKRELAEIQNTFGELLKRLPNKAEVDGLVVDISQAGLASGLVFELFQTDQERMGEGGFYKELPIRLRMRGDYHAFGKFVSDVASLPRIVTQHDIAIEADKSPDGLLKFSTIAKIYRYLDPEEEAAAAAASKPAAKGKGKK